MVPEGVESQCGAVEPAVPALPGWARGAPAVGPPPLALLPPLPRLLLLLLFLFLSQHILLQVSQSTFSIYFNF